MTTEATKNRMTNSRNLLVVQKALPALLIRKIVPKKNLSYFVNSPLLFYMGKLFDVVV